MKIFKLTISAESGDGKRFYKELNYPNPATYKTLIADFREFLNFLKGSGRGI